MKFNLEYLLKSGLLSPLTDEGEHYLKSLAYHESAHAVVGIIEGFSIKEIYIVPLETGGGGGCEWSDDVETKQLEDITEEDIEKVKKSIIKAAAGLEAEKLIGNDCEGPASLGFLDDNKFIKTSCYLIEQIEGEAKEVVERSLRADSKEMVLQRWQEIEKLAGILREELSLDRSEIERILPNLF